MSYVVFVCVFQCVLQCVLLCVLLCVCNMWSNGPHLLLVTLFSFDQHCFCRYHHTHCQHQHNHHWHIIIIDFGHFGVCRMALPGPEIKSQNHFLMQNTLWNLRKSPWKPLWAPQSFLFVAIFVIHGFHFTTRLFCQQNLLKSTFIIKFTFVWYLYLQVQLELFNDWTIV